MGIFIFKPVLGRVIFSLTFPWTGWFRNYRFWDGLQFFLPFSSRVLDMDGQTLCGKSALGRGPNVNRVSCHVMVLFRLGWHIEVVT